MNRSRILLLGALILAFVFFGLGYITYSQLFILKPNTKVTKTVSQTSNSNPSRPAWFDNLTPDERNLFESMPENASAEERKIFNNLLRGASVIGGEIRIGEACHPNPLVLRLGKLQDIKVINEGTKEATIVFSKGQRYSIKPGESGLIEISSDMKGRNFGYGCNGFPAGFILVPSE